jgi:hypothetical protein
LRRSYINGKLRVVTSVTEPEFLRVKKPEPLRFAMVIWAV